MTKIDDWHENERKREDRLQYYTYNFKQGSSLFLYTSCPLDQWVGWDEYWLSQKIFYEIELSNHSMSHPFLCKSAKDNCRELESLLIKGIQLYPEIFKDLRGEPIKWMQTIYDEPSKGMGQVREFVIALKQDNNGQCFAFTYARGAEKHLPNDTCSWELHDVRQ